MIPLYRLYGHASERAYLEHIAAMHKADPKTALSLCEQIALFVKSAQEPDK